MKSKRRIEQLSATQKGQPSTISRDLTEQTVPTVLLSNLPTTEHHLEREISKRKCSCDPYAPFTHAGPFILGQQLSDAQFIDLDQFVAKRTDDTDPNRYYMLKIVTLPHKKEDETYSQRQAKLLIYNEYSVLSLLRDQDGVIHHHGLYMDYFYEEAEDGQQEMATDSNGINELLEKEVFRPSAEQPSDKDKFIVQEFPNQLKKLPMRRLILALDCYVPHIYCSTVYPLPKFGSKFTTVNSEYENLQEYVKRYKIIPEMKALLMFKKIVDIIYNLHEKNIAHRDLRLENILFKHRDEKICLVNFGLARYVINDRICICDHRGSSAYISPDVLRRKPYNPKASDCWALGIIFYTMLFGRFPFYASTFPELFKMINAGQFQFPPNALIWNKPHEVQPIKTDTHPIVVSSGTVDIINALIVTDSALRMSIVDLQKKLIEVITAKFKAKSIAETQKLVKSGKCPNDQLQVVPDIDSPELQHPKSKYQICLLSCPSKFDEKVNSYFDLKSVTRDAASLMGEPNQDSEFNSAHHLVDNSSQINRIYNNMEASMHRKPWSSGGGDEPMHLQEHNYSQRGVEVPSKSRANAFKLYLNTEFRFTPRHLSSVYSRHRQRFYLRSGTSMYETEHKNYTSLLLETSDSPRKRYRTRSMLKAGSSSSPLHRSASSGFVRLGSKMAKSNFLVVKVDGDIRPACQSEMELAESFLAQ